MLEATNVRKSYGSRVAVDGVSVAISAGETVGLLGPNGAGKSTLVGMLCGLLKPDSGSVRIAGVDDPTRPEVRRQLGLCPQTVALYEGLSAEENLRFFGKLYGLSGDRLTERVAHGLEFAGLVDRRRDLVRTFSGGMARRLNMAAALVHDPPALLFDEPTVGVDPQSRNHLFECVLKLKAAGKTILLTTHYMEEAERLCDRIVVIDLGQKLAEGGVGELIAAHGGPALVEGEISRAGRIETVRESTSEPWKAIAALQGVGEWKSLRVARPTLESVFLQLTGKRLRDD